MTRPHLCVAKAGDVTFIARVHRAASAFAETGDYEVTVLSVAPRDPPKTAAKPVTEPTGYRVVAKPVRTRGFRGRVFAPLRRLEIAFRWLGWMLRHRPDVFVCHNLEALLLAWPAHLITRAPVVYNSDELEASRSPSAASVRGLRQSVRRRTDAFLSRRCAAVAAADESRARAMEQMYGLSPGSVATIRNLPIFRPPGSDDRLRLAAGIPDGNLIILYQGVFAPGRGLETSIDALQHLTDLNVDLTLLGYGSPDYVDRLLARADALGVGDRVHVVPPVPWRELVDWTAGADVAAVLIENTSLSYYYAAPNKFYEAIMAGIPYVASNFPEMSSVHENVRGGFLVDPSQPEAVAAAIRRLALDPDLRAEMRARELNAAATELRWDRDAARLVSLVEGAMSA